MARRLSRERSRWAAEIRSPADVIEAAGGNRACAEMFGVSLQAITNWKRRGLPPETYHVLSSLLISRGFSAPPSLWKMRIPKVAAAE